MQASVGDHGLGGREVEDDACVLHVVVSAMGVYARFCKIHVSL